MDVALYSTYWRWRPNCNWKIVQCSTKLRYFFKSRSWRHVYHPWAKIVISQTPNIYIYIYIYIYMNLSSIKLWLQALISLWFQSLTWPYSVNFKDTKNIFSQNVLYNMWIYFLQKMVNLKKKYFGWVFTERVTYMCECIYENKLINTFMYFNQHFYCHQFYLANIILLFIYVYSIF